MITEQYGNILFFSPLPPTAIKCISPCELFQTIKKKMLASGEKIQNKLWRTTAPIILSEHRDDTKGESGELAALISLQGSRRGLQCFQWLHGRLTSFGPLVNRCLCHIYDVTAPLRYSVTHPALKCFSDRSSGTHSPGRH